MLWFVMLPILLSGSGGGGFIITDLCVQLSYKSKKPSKSGLRTIGST